LELAIAQPFLAPETQDCMDDSEKMGIHARKIVHTKKLQKYENYFFKHC